MDRPLPWVLLGWVAGLATAAVVALTVVAFFTLGPGRSWSDDSEPTTAPRSIVLPDLERLPFIPREMPTATLLVHEDGCGVIRSEVPPSTDNLTWHIEDEDGFEVLGRSAENETRYRFYRSGTYTVVLQAFDGTKYVPISNTVTITC